MKKRKVLTILLGVVIACTGLVGAWAFSLPPRFSGGDIAKIKLGMTKDEVVTILGCLPGGYDGFVGNHDVEGQLKRGTPSQDLIMPRKNGEIWACRGGAVEVCFIDDKVSLIQPLTAKLAENWWKNCWRRLLRN